MLPTVFCKNVGTCELHLLLQIIYLTETYAIVFNYPIRYL